MTAATDILYGRQGGRLVPHQPDIRKCVHCHEPLLPAGRWFYCDDACSEASRAEERRRRGR